MLMAPEAGVKEQDSSCCFSPASPPRPLELLCTIQLPALEGGASRNEVVAQGIKNVRGSGVAELREVFLSVRSMRKQL